MVTRRIAAVDNQKNPPPACVIPRLLDSRITGLAIRENLVKRVLEGVHGIGSRKLGNVAVEKQDVGAARVRPCASPVTTKVYHVGDRPYIERLLQLIRRRDPSCLVHFPPAVCDLKPAILVLNLYKFVVTAARDRFFPSLPPSRTGATKTSVLSADPKSTSPEVPFAESSPTSITGQSRNPSSRSLSGRRARRQGWAGGDGRGETALGADAVATAGVVPADGTVAGDQAPVDGPAPAAARPQQPSALLRQLFPLPKSYSPSDQADREQLADENQVEAECVGQIGEAHVPPDAPRQPMEPYREVDRRN